MQQKRYLSMVNANISRYLPTTKDKGNWKFILKQKLRQKPRLRRAAGTKNGFNERGKMSNNNNRWPNGAPAWHSTANGRQILNKLEKYGMKPYGNRGTFGFTRNKQYLTQSEAMNAIKKEQKLINNLNNISRLIAEYKNVSNNLKEYLVTKQMYPYASNNTSRENKLKIITRELNKMAKK